MDEDVLEEALNQYKQQLNQIDAVLQLQSNETTESNDREDLIKLKEDLNELIKTTEESLLCLKKSKLLQFLDQVDASSSTTTIPGNANFTQDDTDIMESADKPHSLTQIKELEDSISGTQCRAPYIFDWGLKGYYNAMVLHVEQFDEESEDLQVCVLFMNPTHISMVPCPHFLDGKCRYDDEQCRYSHGCVVNMSDLRAYSDPDFGSLKVNDKCLAKYEDGVWYKATILSMTKDEVNIHYDTYNMDKCVKLEDVLPIGEMNDADISDSENESKKYIAEDSNDIEEIVTVEFCPGNNGNYGNLGEWEKHTTGIASKLMEKMGYVAGKGLGKNEDGRIEPVEIIILPAGKSLDACAELREKNKLKQPFKKKKSKQNSVAKVSVQNIFEFINNKLGGKKGNLQDLKQNDKFNALDRRKKGEQKNKANYNVELFKLEQEKARIQKQINKQKECVSRNSGRGDFTVAEQARLKMVTMQQKIKQLEDQEKWLKQKIHQNSEHRKLTVF